MSDQVVSNQVLLDFSNRKLLSPVPKKLYESAKVYFSTKDLELLQTAYNVAFEAHKNQFRKEGSAYITHPVEVASILIELHLDISASDKKEATSRFSDMLVGYAKGVGFPCKIKPDAFAATSVADKHNK